MKSIVLASVVAIAGFVSACSDDNDAHVIAIVPVEQASVLATRSNTFIPRNVSLGPLGGEVTWSFESTSHSVVFDPVAGAPDNITNGVPSARRPFNQPGVYNYHCAVHPEMTGSVLVGQ